MWMSPALALVAVFLVWPVIDTVRRSFFDGDSSSFVGFENYQFIIDNPQPISADTHTALLNNLLWLVVFPAVTVVIGLLIAVLAGRVRYESVAKSAIFIPMAISFVAAAVIWRFMYELDPDQGTVNAVLARLGGDPVPWLQDRGGPQTWFTSIGPETWTAPFQINNFSLITVGVWMWTGFAVVILSAGLKGISTEVLEAARVDGANEWQVFRRVILPIMMPTIVVIAATLIIQALKNFDLIFVLTGGRFGTDIVATLFYKQAFEVRDFGVGAALAVVLLAFVVPVMVLTIRRFQAQEEAR
ncbi:MAG: ABC transporter permease subunit [Dehalococcoidia bacterium]|nr:ABC transporter permease subunit [Dehalococcoidia bacterium]